MKNLSKNFLITFKKHIAPLALIGILCTPALLFLYLQIHEKIVQHTMSEMLEHTNLQRLVIHNNDVQWYKKNKEIIVNSMMFDVHNFKVTGDSTLFEGLFDEEETHLKNQVKELLEQSAEKAATRNLIIAKMIFQFSINNDGNINLLHTTSAVKTINYLNSYARLLSVDISIPYPPPRV